MCLNFGVPEINEFSVTDNWKIDYFRYPNTKHITINPPARRDDPLGVDKAHGLPPIQVDKPWCIYFVPPSLG